MKATTSKKMIRVFTLCLVLTATYTGCTKKEEIIDTDTSSATDNFTAENSFSTVFRTVNESAEATDNARSGCPTLTFVTTSTQVAVNQYPKTLNVDYGTSGCNDKKGSITAVFSGPFEDAGTVVNITYNNYYDGKYRLNASSHTITNNGPNAAGNYVFTINVSNASLISSSDTATWSSTKSIEWIEGKSTKGNASDNVFLVTGTSSGKSAKRVSYTAEVKASNPLKISSSCEWIESGVLTLTPKGKAERVIDYGNTGCDNKATVTVNGKSYEISM